MLGCAGILWRNPQRQRTGIRVFLWPRNYGEAVRASRSCSDPGRNRTDTAKVVWFKVRRGAATLPSLRNGHLPEGGEDGNEKLRNPRLLLAQYASKSGSSQGVLRVLYSHQASLERLPAYSN